MNSYEYMLVLRSLFRSTSSAPSAKACMHPTQPTSIGSRCFSVLPDSPRSIESHEVVVTGLGLVTPLGVNVADSWAALLAGKTGTRKLEAHHLPDSHGPLLPRLPCRVAALLPREALADALSALNKEDKKVAKVEAPFVQYALIAAMEAIADAGWNVEQWSPEQRADVGVAIGSGMSNSHEIISTWELLRDDKMRKISPYFVPKILPNMAAGAVGIKYGFNGPTHTASTACATGLHSIGDAYRMVQRGDATCMVAGASEACVDALSIAGFCRLKALTMSHNETPEQASRPFDELRDGFVIGEGAGCMVLENKAHAAKRNARVYAEVRGYGMSGDGHHITQPHPEGLGASLAMRRALDRSGIAPEHIKYINAHATSTPLGDKAEQKAILAAFGHENGNRILVSSTKGATGHLLGAAGAVEAIFTALALYHSVAPPTANLHNPDPEILQNLVGKTARKLPGGPKAALCNAFGFGSTNASLLLGTPTKLRAAREDSHQVESNWKVMNTNRVSKL